MSMYYIRSNFLLHQKPKTKKPKNQKTKKTKLLTGIQFSSKFFCFFWYFVFLVSWFFGIFFLVL